MTEKSSTFAVAKHSILIRMNNKILFCAMLCIACTISMNVNAQLEVLSSGNVDISKCASINGAGVCDSVALNVLAHYLTQGGNGYYGVLASAKQGHPLHMTTGRSIGVLGRVLPFSINSNMESGQPRPSSSPFYAGILGIAAKGIGVYGTVSSSLISLPNSWTEGNYAGYFNGNVKVTGTLTAQTVTQTSDARVKENIVSLNTRNAVNLLARLNPVAYTFKKDSSTTIFSETEARLHYGLIAQELQAIAPELVYEDGAGNLSVNYIELIPILIKTVQDLSAKVDAQDQKIKELQSKK